MNPSPTHQSIYPNGVCIIRMFIFAKPHWLFRWTPHVQEVFVTSRVIKNVYGFETTTFDIRRVCLACINLFFMRLHVQSATVLWICFTYTHKNYLMANKLRNIVWYGFVHLEPPGCRFLLFSLMRLELSFKLLVTYVIRDTPLIAPL